VFLVVTTKPFALLIDSPAKLAGLFCVVLFFSGCQTGKSPEDVNTAFWQALAQGQIEKARTHATENSQHLVNLQDIEKNSTIEIGEAIVEDSNASVPTTITRHNKRVTFDTVLMLEQDVWKVDYIQTQMNISMLPLDDVFKSLQNLGGTFAKQLEKQLPLIQKEMESLGEELKKQIDKFGRSLENPQDPNAKKTHPGSI
jgi:hypothetical protein